MADETGIDYGSDQLWKFSTDYEILFDVLIYEDGSVECVRDDVGYEQRDGFTSECEGLRVECPFCNPDDLEWQLRPFLNQGECHECGREFDLVVEWDADPAGGRGD